MRIKAEVCILYYKLTLVVFNTDSPSIPEVNCSAPDFFTIASVVCLSDPSLKPYKNKIKQLKDGKETNNSFYL